VKGRSGLYISFEVLDILSGLIRVMWNGNEKKCEIKYMDKLKWGLGE
jgi:hypothetical protein